MNNAQTTNVVKALLIAEGFGPRLTFCGFAAAVRLADAVSRTIESPIRRALFAASAADELARLDYQPFEGLDDKACCLAEAAEGRLPTPCGSTELWGALMQSV